MKCTSITVAVTILMTLSFVTGCTTNQQPTVVSSELTDEDWDYFVFHYTSGKDLYGLFMDGFDIVNEEISLFDPANSSFLLKCNASNIDYLSQLSFIAEAMKENISIYKIRLAGFTLSDQMKDHGLQQNKLFNVYSNLSNVFLSIDEKVQNSYNSSVNDSILISISNEMNLLFVGDETISLIMDDQLATIINISDEAWDEWAKERDWGFMD